MSFTGFLTQDEGAAELAGSDLFVLPSLAEGVLMQAMTTGLPVIATRIASSPELVEDGFDQATEASTLAQLFKGTPTPVK